MNNKTLHSFFYEAHTEKGAPSSKRLYGGIGFIVCQLCIIAATVLSLSMTGELSNTVASLIDFDMVASTALLGLSTITRAFGGNKTDISNEKSEN